MTSGLLRGLVAATLVVAPAHAGLPATTEPRRRRSNRDWHGPGQAPLGPEQIRFLLGRGITQNLAVSPVQDDGVLWSGLRLEDRAAVRAVSQGEGEGTLRLDVWAGCCYCARGAREGGHLRDLPDGSRLRSDGQPLTRPGVCAKILDMRSSREWHMIRLW